MCVATQVGAFQEVVVFDRSSQSLLVTDLVVSVTRTAPEVLRVNDARALQYHARDSPMNDAPALDDEEKLSAGWRKICLFALYFQVSALCTVPIVGRD